jgi:hypothetical protein
MTFSLDQQVTVKTLGAQRVEAGYLNRECRVVEITFAAAIVARRERL